MKNSSICYSSAPILTWDKELSITLIVTDCNRKLISEPYWQISELCWDRKRLHHKMSAKLHSNALLHTSIFGLPSFWLNMKTDWWHLILFYTLKKYSDWSYPDSIYILYPLMIFFEDFSWDWGFKDSDVVFCEILDAIVGKKIWSWRRIFFLGI